MTLDLDVVGMSGMPTEQTWTSKDALLYALAVGAGQSDPAAELEFTTENSSAAQKVLPSFICVAADGPLPETFELDWTKVLHAEMRFELFGELPTEGRVVAETTIDAIYDKGSGALVSTTTTVVDATTGAQVARLGSGLFLIGEGGFGGDRGPRSEQVVAPDGPPDATVEYQTLPNQALLYRLTGDRNPLHSDPEFARRAGFDRPILHGMCTYGFTARALLHEVAGSQPARFRSMSARFSKPVLPGELLTTQIWHTGEGAVFRTLDSTGDAVLDRGRMEVRR